MDIYQFIAWRKVPGGFKQLNNVPATGCHQVTI
jgi:hypothetical protein